MQLHLKLEATVHRSNCHRDNLMKKWPCAGFALTIAAKCIYNLEAAKPLTRHKFHNILPRTMANTKQVAPAKRKALSRNVSHRQEDDSVRFQPMLALSRLHGATIVAVYTTRCCKCGCNHQEHDIERCNDARKVGSRKSSPEHRLSNSSIDINRLKSLQFEDWTMCIMLFIILPLWSTQYRKHNHSLNAVTVAAAAFGT